MLIPKYNSTLGTLRAYHLAAIVFISSFLSGYDSGVAGGVLTFASFEKDFHYKTAQKTKVNSLTVGLENLGALCAALLIFPMTNKIGRKYCIMISAFVFVVGSAIQTAKTNSLAGWYVGRFVSGMGQGAMSVVVPMYSAEMTPKEIRGRCGSFYQWMYTWGIFVAYWVDYGVAADIAKTSSSLWQIPIGLQLVSGGLLFLGAFTLPESTRWLLTQNREDEAWKALTWVRADTSEKTLQEFKEIKLGLQAELATKQDFSYRELWNPDNRLRFFLGAMLFIFQNSTGSSALAVFGPQFFKLLVGSSGNRDLLLTGLFGAVKVIACSFFIWVLSERFGRRTFLTFGSAGMAACMLCVALIDKYKAPPATGDVTAAGKATVALIYLDIMIYNCSWGPVPWAYVPEIFPQRIRALGMGVSIAAHWTSSFVFTFSSPYMIANIGWATFLVFALLDVVSCIFCWFLVRETKGKSLEIASGVEWSVVEKASDDVSERGDGYVSRTDSKGNIVVDEATGNQMEVVGAKDSWSVPGLKHRS